MEGEKIKKLLAAAKRIVEASEQNDDAVNEVFRRMHELREAVQEVEAEESK